MRYKQDLAARVHKADREELNRLARLYPNNARLQTLVAQELKRLPDLPKSRHPFIPSPRV